jgi:hypothetical protein
MSSDRSKPIAVSPNDSAPLSIEAKVQEAAAELVAVNDALALEIDERHQHERTRIGSPGQRQQAPM